LLETVKEPVIWLPENDLEISCVNAGTQIYRTSDGDIYIKRGESWVGRMDVATAEDIESFGVTKEEVKKKR